MNKSQETLKREPFGRKNIVFVGMVMVLALFVTGRAAAAPGATASKSRTTTELDPIALRPVWISSSSRAVTPPARTATATAVGQRLGVFSVQVASVQVPARPSARSPYVPPRYPWNPR